MDPKEAVRSLAIGRLVLGACLLVAPRLSTSMWLGHHRESPAARLLTRAVGARDAGLGAATLAAADGGEALRPLLLAGLLADTTDLVATVALREHLPRLAVPLLVGAAGSGIALGAIALTGADDGAPVPA